MKVTTWNTPEHGNGVVVVVNHREAVALINSLTTQILTGAINQNRAEFTDASGTYFSVGVKDKYRHCAGCDGIFPLENLTTKRPAGDDSLPAYCPHCMNGVVT